MQEPIPRGALLDRFEVRDDEGRPIGLIYGAGDLGLEINHQAHPTDPMCRHHLAASMFNGTVQELLGRGYESGSLLPLNGELILTVRNLNMVFQKFESW